MRNRLSKIATVVTMVILFIPQTDVASAEDLGLTLQINQGNSSKSGLESNTRLWFVVPPGASKSRTVEIRNTTGSSETISLSIGALKRVNGNSQMAPGEISVISKWARFSKNDFILKPGQVSQVDLILDIPITEKINSYSGMLLVKASTPTSTKVKDNYSVPGAAQIAAPIFLGVGTEDEFVTSFEIKGVEGVRTSEGKALRVEIKNSGKTPVSISGDIQATGITFITGRVGPFPYLTETIAPGETKFADALVGEQISESRWKIFVSATQGDVTETREFEVDISYTGGNGFLGIVLKILIPVSFLILLYWSIRVFRSKKSNRDEGSLAPLSTKRKVSIPDLTEKQIQAIVTEFRLASEEKPAPKKRATTTTAKRAVAKKVAKKATPKKTVTKKVAKKSSQNKPVRKATVKKATVKKVIVKKARNL